MLHKDLGNHLLNLFLLNSPHTLTSREQNLYTREDKAGQISNLDTLEENGRSPMTVSSIRPSHSIRDLPDLAAAPTTDTRTH